jgi:hypothetical protein
LRIAPRSAAVVAAAPTHRDDDYRTHRNGHRVQCFKLTHQSTEFGKAGNTFTFELAFPSNGLDDLADDLRQPPQRMSPVKRERVGSLLQEVAAFTD